MLFSSAIAERGWRSFLAVDMTSVSPLPHHQLPARTSPSRAPRYRATNLRKKQREGSVRASRGVCAWTKPPRSERCPAPLRCDAAVEEAEPLRGAAGPAAHLCLSTSPTEDGAKDRVPGNSKGHPEERLVSLSA